MVFPGFIKIQTLAVTPFAVSSRINKALNAWDPFKGPQKYLQYKILSIGLVQPTNEPTNQRTNEPTNQRKNETALPELKLDALI